MSAGMHMNLLIRVRKANGCDIVLVNGCPRALGDKCEVSDGLLVLMF